MLSIMIPSAEDIYLSPGKGQLMRKLMYGTLSYHYLPLLLQVDCQVGSCV